LGEEDHAAGAFGKSLPHGVRTPPVGGNADNDTLPAPARETVNRVAVVGAVFAVCARVSSLRTFGTLRTKEAPESDEAGSAALVT
jgi:hypothetical protein